MDSPFSSLPAFYQKLGGTLNMTQNGAATTTPRLVYVTTAPYSANAFLKGQLSYMRKRGFDVVVVSALGDELRIISEREKVATVAVPMEREISPLKDLASLV